MPAPKPTRAITFDCYGTLIDWETGMWTVAQDLLRRSGVNTNRKQFLSVWEPIQFEMINGPYKKYRAILGESFMKAAAAMGGKATRESAATFAGSMADWEPFPDVPGALERLRALYILAPITNTDDDFIAASARKMGNPFHHVFTAQAAKAYKPSKKPFEVAIKKLGFDPGEVLHVGFGYRYDLGPAKAVGFRTAWLNRGSEALPEGFSADFELAGMEDLVRIATKAC